MELRSRVISAAGMVASGSVMRQLLSFVRTAVIARMLSLEDFGIAATFMMTMAFAEMLTDFGVEKVMVQATHGDDRRFEGTVHLLLVIRGLILAFVLLLLARPISVHLFDVPHAAWAFYVLALIPLIRAFSHVDYLRYQREMRFRPTVVVQVVPELIATILAWPFLYWLGTYAAVLWLIIGQSVVVVIMGHVVAERPYRWAWSREAFRYIVRFGWPLLVSGFLMYGILQGDRVVIGSMLDMTALALFTAALKLTQAPSMFTGRVLTSIALPLLARLQDDRPAFDRQHGQISVVCGLLGGGLVGTLLVVAGPLVVLVYGDRFAEAATIVGWLLAAEGIRMVRYAPIFAALSLGDTQNLLISNIVRGSALIVVIAVVARGGGLVAVAIVACFGEAVALLVSLLLVQVRHGIPMSTCLIPAAVAGIWPTVSAIILVAFEPQNWFVIGGISAFMGFAVLGTMLAAFPSLRLMLRRGGSGTSGLADGSQSAGP